jgi:hypothetical protein
LIEILEKDRSKVALLKTEDDVTVETLELDDVVGMNESVSNEPDVGFDEDSTNTVTSEYDHSRYFDTNYKITLVDIAKNILAEKNGITLHELSLDIANLHGLSRTSKKQREYIIELLKPWAGLSRDGVHRPVVWSSPEEIVDEIPWRGLAPWGEERDWNEIPYPEAKGLARLALQESPKDPVSYMCNAFNLKRRYEKTLAQFQAWVDEVNQPLKEV